MNEYIEEQWEKECMYCEDKAKKYIQEMNGKKYYLRLCDACHGLETCTISAKENPIVREDWRRRE